MRLGWIGALINKKAETRYFSKFKINQKNTPMLMLKGKHHLIYYQQMAG